MTDDPSIQNIARQGIRRLLDSVEDGDRPTDESLSFDYENATAIEKLRFKINGFVAKSKKRFKGNSFIYFLFSLFSYIVMRVRVFFVILGIIGEIFGEFTETFKRIFVKNLFWGRGGIFRFSLQFSALVIVLIFFVGYIYKTSSPVSGARLNIVTGEEIEGPSSQDLIVQRGSTRTSSPKERGRTGFVKYSVKSGDTLFKISKIYDVSTDTIVWANPFIQNEIIRPGDVLSIPETDGVVIKAKKGDTVYTLAKKYKVTPQVIADKNSLEYPYELRSGESVLIPGAVPLDLPKKTPPKVIYSGVFKPRVTYTSGPSSVPNSSKFLVWPVQNGGTVSQCYKGIYHNGFDIADSGFPKIVAAAPGKVVFSGCQSGSCPPRGIGAWGGVGLAWTVAIDHGNGYSTIYGHLDDIYIGSGSTVSAGQVIGRMGRTGYATGTHLHFMLTRGSWDDFNDLNPVPYFKSTTYSSHISGYCY